MQRQWARSSLAVGLAGACLVAVVAGASVFFFARHGDTEGAGVSVAPPSSGTETTTTTGTGAEGETTELPESPVGDIQAVSAARAGTLGNAPSLLPSWSPDGSRIAYRSYATNLVPGDSNGKWDVFVKDLRTEEVTIVSTSSNGTSGDEESGDGYWSPDGSRIAFDSYATNLVPGDINGEEDVFVKDLRTGEVTLVSVGADGAPGDGGSVGAAWSPDGTRIAFGSYATNLVPGGSTGEGDVFVKDLRTGEVTMVSAGADGAPGDGVSLGGDWSPDGTRIAFGSYATNLVPGDSNGEWDVFVKDLRTGEVTMVSTGVDGTPGDGDPGYFGAAWSPDGSRIAFSSEATDLVSGDSNGGRDVFVSNLRSGEITMASAGADGAPGDGESVGGEWSPDGSRIAFDSYATNLVPGDINGEGDVFVKDLRTGEVTMVSVGADGASGDGESVGAAWSPDGTRIAFGSYATNLVPGDSNGVWDVFVKDLRTGEVTMVSAGVDGNPGDGGSGLPVWSPDGSRIAFLSDATNLVPGDANSASDAFMKTVG